MKEHLEWPTCHPNIRLTNPTEIRGIIKKLPSTKSAGIDQIEKGSVVGPVLFLFFINDIPNFARTSLAIYADDTSVYANWFNAQVATKQTRIHIDKILEYAGKWKIGINRTKTEHIIFNRKFTNLKVYEPLKVENNKIAQAEKCVKYGRCYSARYFLSVSIYRT